MASDTRQAIPETFPAELVDMAAHWWKISGHYPDIVVEFEMAFEGHLDQQRLGRAVSLMLDAQPVLGCRFVVEGKRARWQRDPEAGGHPLQVFESAADFEAFRTSGLDATTSVQLRVGLHPAADGDRMLIKLTHEAGDADALRDLAYQLARIYSALTGDPAYVPPPNHNGDRGLSELTNKRGWWKGLRKPLAAGAREFVRKRAPEFVAPFPDGAAEPWRHLIWEIPVDEARTLAAAARRRGATTNDLFVAGFFLASARRISGDETASMKAYMTVDLRKYLSREKARGPSNLSSAELLRAETSRAADRDAVLAQVVAQTRAMRGLETNVAFAPLVNFLGETYLRWIGFDRLVASVKPGAKKSSRITHVLSYAGAIEAGKLAFGDLIPRDANFLPLLAQPPMIFVGMCNFFERRRGLRGEGMIKFGVAAPRVAEESFREFIEDMLAEMRAFVGPEDAAPSRRRAAS